MIQRSPLFIHARRCLNAVGLISVLVALNGGNAHAAKPVPTPTPAFYPTQYFVTVALDPRYQLVGTGALTEEEAANANCYRFIYNTDGKLKQVAFRRAGAPMPDPLLGVASIDFEYQPGIERRWYHDDQGRLINNVYGIAGEELTLNPAGFPVDIANLDASGARTRDSGGVIHYVRTLDDHNRLIRGRRIGLSGAEITDDNGYFETRTVYDVQGRVIERDNYDASGTLLNNNDGVAIVRTTYTIFPTSMETTESYFDASGQAVEEKSSGVHQLQRTVDNRGLVLDEAYFDVTVAPTGLRGDTVHERRYTYDDRGNKLSEAFFDVNEKPRNQKNPNFARAVYKYDDKNRVIELAFFGDDDTPQVVPSFGAAVIRQDYDDRGAIVRLQFFDGLGKPSPSVKYGAPAIRIKVESDTTIVTLRNGDDHPVKNPIHGYYAFSYKTNTDYPLSPTNRYFDKHGRLLSYFPRVSVINPHLHLLRTNHVMQWSARLGAGAAGLGALLGCFLALRKSSHTKRRKVYVPTPVGRFLGWFAVFAILEGMLRFFLTVYWSWVVNQNGRMSHAIYYVEAIVILFFLYRLNRLRLTMRVLNIARDDIHRLVRDFFAKANLKPEWVEMRNRYVTPPLDVRVNFFQGKNHAYIAFRRRGREGCDLARGLDQFIRGQVGAIQSPVRSAAIALYYPSVAFCYFLLSGTAFYTLWQLLKGF